MNLWVHNGKYDELGLILWVCPKYILSLDGILLIYGKQCPFFSVFYEMMGLTVSFVKKHSEYEFCVGNT